MSKHGLCCRCVMSCRSSCVCVSFFLLLVIGAWHLVIVFFSVNKGLAEGSRLDAASVAALVALVVFDLAFPSLLSLLAFASSLCPCFSRSHLLPCVPFVDHAMAAILGFTKRH